MDELFDQLELEISECKTSMSEYDRDLNKCLGKYEIKSIQETYQTVIYSQSNQNCQNAPSFSFTKTNRFKETKKDDIIGELPLNVSISSIKQAQPSVTFTKSQRFQESKVIPTTPLDPNYDFVKRKASSVVISESKIRDDDVSTQASMVQQQQRTFQIMILIYLQFYKFLIKSTILVLKQKQYIVQTKGVGYLKLCYHFPIKIYIFHILCQYYNSWSWKL